MGRREEANAMTTRINATASVIPKMSAMFGRLLGVFERLEERFGALAAACGRSERLRGVASVLMDHQTDRINIKPRYGTNQTNAGNQSW
jgi:hypothetical protein